MKPAWRRPLASLAYLGSILAALASACGFPGKSTWNPSLLFGGGIAAIALVAIGYSLEKSANAIPRGRLFSIAALFFFMLIGAATLRPIYDGARPIAKTTACYSNLKQLATSLQLYALDESAHLPPAAQWQTASESYRRGEFKCPLATSPYNYGFSDAVSGMSLDSDDQTVMLFEMDSQIPNPHGLEQNAAARHDGRYTFARLDGTVGKSGGQVQWLREPQK
ncbi:MAG: hypothetical protein ACAH95_00325 [Fimbriimonas sp.]